MLGLIREIKTWQQLSLLSGLGTPSSAGGMVSGWAAFPWHQRREHPVLGTDVIPLLLEEKVLCGPQMQSLWLKHEAFGPR